ncbi:hypothetical protein BKA62DRAFT_326172 [Auriculariales sp. MPI-PUGE-AT-0066]|nr:hypothetical protein BKA62DRAFT_326172 [Auriculariales sp. MPI-PUGE-AT-0066]
MLTMRAVPLQLQWTEHISPPNPPPGAPDPATTHPHRIVQTHGNRDLTSASFQMMSGGWTSDGQKLGKPSGACTRCKKLKMKCDLKSGETKCQRCKGGDHDCIPARRRPRRPRAVGSGSVLPLASEPVNLAGPSPRRQHLQPHSPTSHHPQHQHQQPYPDPYHHPQQQQQHMSTLQWTDPLTTSYPSQPQSFQTGGGEPFRSSSSFQFTNGPSSFDLAAPGGYAPAPYGHGQQAYGHGHGHAHGHGHGQGAVSLVYVF